MTNKISLYISYYYDYEYLKLCINNIYNLVDEIILCDGPYEYMIHDLQLFNIPLQMSEQDIQLLQKTYPNLKYYHGIFKNEIEKRIFCYNKCVNNLVLVIDSDEMINIAKTDISNFYEEDVDVGGFSIVNLCQTNHCFDDIKNSLHIFRLFKKQKISSKEHLDYLWLIADYKQQPMKHISKIYKNVMIYHYCLMRPYDSLIVKYLFYVNLYEKMNSTQTYFNIIEHLTNIDLPIDTIKKTFMQSRVEGLGIPDNKKIHNNYSKNNQLEIQKKYIKFLCNPIILQADDILVVNIPTFILINNDCGLTIELHNNIKHIVYEIYDPLKNTLIAYQEIKNTNIIPIFLDEPSLFYAKIMIRDVDAVHRIKRVTYHKTK